MKENYVNIERGGGVKAVLLRLVTYVTSRNKTLENVLCNLYLNGPLSNTHFLF